jgi:uncharacterized protein YecT (DUF1311 family)
MVRKFRYIALGLLFGLARIPFPVTAAAASQDGRIDCKTASTVAQNTICISDDLSKLDRRTAVVFSGVLHTHKRAGQLDDPQSSAFALQKSQDDWRQSREKCGADSGCLEKSMRARFYHLIGRRNPSDKRKIDAYLGEFDYLEARGGMLITRISDKEVLFLMNTTDADGTAGVQLAGFLRLAGDASGLYLRKNDTKPCARLVPNKAPYYLVDSTGLAGCARTGKHIGMYKWQYR